MSPPAADPYRDPWLYPEIDRSQRHAYRGATPRRLAATVDGSPAFALIGSTGRVLGLLAGDFYPLAQLASYREAAATFPHFPNLATAIDEVLALAASPISPPSTSNSNR